MCLVKVSSNHAACISSFWVPVGRLLVVNVISNYSAPKYCKQAGFLSPTACCAERPDSSASSRGKIAVGASAFDILPTRGVLEAGQTCTVEFAYYARPGQKASTTAVCDVEGGPTYTLPVSADSNAIKYRPSTMCMHAVTYCAADLYCSQATYPCPIDIALMHLNAFNVRTDS